MSPSRLSRCMAIAAAIGIACVFSSFPAAADSPVQVTFKDHNPWTQELGSVDRYNDSHEYSVEVGAGKTFQINLVTRDPNVFFKVRNETADKQLVDTYKTGATTWSTPNASAATYLIHVYVEPYAMQRGEVAKYALQIGQYGAADMQAATTAVTFKDNNPWTQEVSSLNSTATAHDYTVAIAAGQTLKVNLIAHKPGVHFKVTDQAGQELADTGKTGPAAGTATWSTAVAAPTTYTIHVYADPSALPPGKQTQYALQIGHYPTAGTQPATPAAAGSTGASSAPAPAGTTGG